MKDKILIKAIKEGSEEAFRELVELYKDKVFNTCYGFIRNTQDADDIAQDVFIKVFQNIVKFREESTVSTWIYRIAVNLSLNYVKKNKQNYKVDLNCLSEVEDDYPNNINQIREELLWEAINNLPPYQRKAIVLTKIEGLSYKEVADILDHSLSSVESLIFRAKKNLKKSLEKKIKKIL